MKYRIKIVTYQNGRVAYYAYVKRGLFWCGLMSDAETVILMGFDCYSRESALKRIGLHYSGNQKMQKIEFEYITK